jgi:hypothetical protein
MVLAARLSSSAMAWSTLVQSAVMPRASFASNPNLIIDISPRIEERNAFEAYDKVSIP